MNNIQRGRVTCYMCEISVVAEFWRRTGLISIGFGLFIVYQMGLVHGHLRASLILASVGLYLTSR